MVEAIGFFIRAHQVGNHIAHDVVMTAFISYAPAHLYSLIGLMEATAVSLLTACATCVPRLFERIDRSAIPDAQVLQLHPILQVIKCDVALGAIVADVHRAHLLHIGIAVGIEHHIHEQIVKAVLRKRSGGRQADNHPYQPSFHFGAPTFGMLLMSRLSSLSIFR